MADSFKQEPGHPCWVLFCFVAFVPCALLSSTSLLATLLMAAFGTGTVTLELFHRVERNLRPNEGRDSRIGTIPILQDFLIVLRVLATTLMPMLLFTFGGASFVLTTQAGRVAEGCRVAELPVLAQEGYTAFSCVDGFVPIDLQLGVPAWDDEMDPPESRRLQESGEDAPGGIDARRTVGESEGNRFGFIAPIFESRQALADGSSPVAWAVKAGSPVQRSACESKELGATCGFFALRLQADFSRLPAPPRFGEGWGYNITHFSVDRMTRGAEKLTKMRLLTPAPTLAARTFVVAEDTQQYFGQAHTLLYVAGGLLVVGLLDRLATAADGTARVSEEGDPRYDRLVLDLPPGMAPGRGDADAGLLGQVSDFWVDPLNTKQIGSLTEAIHTSAPPPRREAWMARRP